MTRAPITVSGGTSLRDAMELFTREHISGAPVTDAGILVGIISSSDLLAFAAAPPERAATASSEIAYEQLPDLDPDAGLELVDDTLSDGAFFTDLLSDADTDVDMRFAGMMDPGMDVLDDTPSRTP